MKLTHTQYRLLKSRSKSKLEQFTSAYLNNPPAIASAAFAR
jgi:hypothetical protein